MDEERSTKKNKVSGDGTVDRNEANNVKHDANDSDIVGKDSEGEDFITDDIDGDDRDLMLQSWIREVRWVIRARGLLDPPTPPVEGGTTAAPKRRREETTSTATATTANLSTM